MKLEIYNSVHTSESLPSRVNVWKEKERDTHGRVRESVAGEKKRFNFLCLKVPQYNTTSYNELYVHNIVGCKIKIKQIKMTEPNTNSLKSQGKEPRGEF